MSASLRALAPGPFVTIQDAGRRGWRRFGVASAGAMDWPALRAANTLVGNEPDAAALEFAQFGGTWEVAAPSCRVAVTGGRFAVRVDDRALAAWQSYTLSRGQILTIRGAPDAVWGYLAIAGGLALPPQLGSRATHLRSVMGGIDGRTLVEGDAVPLRLAHAPDRRERRMRPPDLEIGPLRVVLGPQDDYFTPATIADFLAATYRISYRGDRMGSWLDGPAIAHAAGYNVLSDALVPGCIQVPGSGQPLVLLMDCQTIGGYPKLATIVTADLPRFAQLRPGSPVRFRAIGVAEAQALYRDFRARLDAAASGVEPCLEPLQRPFWLRA